MYNHASVAEGAAEGRRGAHLSAGSSLRISASCTAARVHAIWSSRRSGEPSLPSFDCDRPLLAPPAAAAASAACSLAAPSACCAALSSSSSRDRSAAPSASPSLLPSARAAVVASASAALFAS